MKDLIALLRADAWVMPLFRSYRKPLVLALVLGFLMFVFASALMFTSGYLISASAVVATVLALHLPLILVRVFGIGRPILNYLERLESHDWVLRMTSKLRVRLYRAVAPDAVRLRASRRTGELLGLLADDVAHVQDLYLRTLFPMTVSALLYVAGAVCLGFFSPALLCTWMLALGAVLVVLPCASVAVVGPRERLVKRATDELYADLSEDVAGANDWIYAGREAERVEKAEERLARRAKLREAIDAFDRVRDVAVQACFLVVILSLVAWAAAAFGGAERAGTDAANWIAAFSLAFFPLMDAFVVVPPAAERGLASLDAIRRLNALDAGAAARPAPPTHLPRPPYDVVFDDVTFSYGPGEVPVLRNLTCTIPAGQKVALLGRSGEGKSTFAALLRGDFVASAGSVTVGGASLVGAGDAAARFVSVVSQDAHVFDLSIGENVRLGRPDATDEDVWRALWRVQLAEHVQNLPEGLATLVGEGGYRLSGGQRHRLAVARALVADSPVVVLDEPFAGLDPTTERDVLALVADALADRTVVLVTHHLAGVSAFDRVMFLDGGRVALDGAPQALFAESERYRRLYELDNPFETRR
ncbi:thiol reductant ABC exporter subunit CydC [Eggerthellaceae bacterium zg-887]|uniref:thiol reductant ABC exporter subunit CydC n=1 Tax=Xiamenia xianingshaonis TaxID=2682776 RepID=UPI001409DA7F|nr:thiol reductant ABC exporter subunit CydC [Xiamenia xianingshaonis]NHM16172.1 thiol reductant ABC exporter subunit CydC [Xiamenia xianingshaonis]